MWEPGTTIVHQEVWAGRWWAARPLIVVEDTAERILLWIPQDTVRKVPVTPPSRPDPSTRQAQIIENLARGDWVMGEHIWDVSSLWILRPSDWHTVLVSWRGDGSHFGWYANLQYPFRRTAIGIEAMDLMLDIVVEPDLEWRWKDEAEFDEILDPRHPRLRHRCTNPTGSTAGDRPDREPSGTVLRTMAGMETRPRLGDPDARGWLGRARPRTVLSRACSRLRQSVGS